MCPGGVRQLVTIYWLSKRLKATLAVFCVNTYRSLSPINPWVARSVLDPCSIIMIACTHYVGSLTWNIIR